VSIPSRLTAVAALASTVGAAGCGVVYRAGLKLYYKPAALADQHVVRDISYVPASTDPKHKLNLFTPESSKGWPVVVFVHGGNWDEGDRDYRFAGADIYNNIGRFFAKNGIGTAVISYRLQPHVDWRAQPDDVRRAVAWVHAHVAEYGGRPDQIILMGHSAGAQLALRTGLDQASLAAAGVPPASIRGMIGVAGAGYDMTDLETYRLGADPKYYAKRFALGASDTAWRAAASPIQFVTSSAPPTLILLAGGESKALKRQSQLMYKRIGDAGAESRLLMVPGLNHSRIVPTLSRADRPAGAAVLEFVNQVRVRS
jgi:acetyl esterase/lipase